MPECLSLSEKLQVLQKECERIVKMIHPEESNPCAADSCRIEALADGVHYHGDQTIYC